ncbi:MAG: N(4)-(beta-N-acetylglucosaminyl)-L-asparaginase [Bacteroidetes bacterium]|nr:N(4)-(beta-N-acetylglucosaminyl)-L-asparaginase [Bacteroidota bacterium]
MRNKTKQKPFSRRKFLSRSLLSSLAVTIGGFSQSACSPIEKEKKKDTSSPGGPLVISTWDFGIEANQAAWETLKSGGSSLDAVEVGAKVPEADPTNASVGYGGMPDRDGNVTLDACIMDYQGNCGSVSFLQHIKHPISVARKVMEDTPHVMLSGEGALQFALSKGFKKENLLTEAAREKWEEWKKEEKYQPIINIENHDTIGMLAIDGKGNIAGACTTSGLAFKMHGRVGDSPVIGAAMYTDNDVGGAVATGMGEAVLKTLGSFLVVELMRQGRSPQEACEEAIKRIAKKQNYTDFQVGYLAVNKAGEHGAYSIQPGFNFALYQDGKNRLIDAASLVKGE